MPFLQTATPTANSKTATSMAGSDPIQPPPHPLAPLSETEFLKAREIVLNGQGDGPSFFFRAIALEEPKKDEMVPFLVAEHAGQLSAGTPRPHRLARVQYDVINQAKNRHQYTQSVVDLNDGCEVSRVEAAPHCQPSFTVGEFSLFQDACVKSPLFRKAMDEFVLPPGFEVTIDPWPYGGPEPDEHPPRWMQGLVFARDTSNGNRDSNHYAYPIPIIAVMDWATKEVIRVDRLATSVDKGAIFPPERKDGERKKLFANSKPAEYLPELLKQPMRKDYKPIDITQPEGASFTVYEDNLVEWQKWRFRLGFTPREGAVLHDVCYDNRSILYRLSYSELTVPYADPRYPFYRKQAFDLGDGGVGKAANNLELGCDCLGAIHYFNALLAAPDGSPTLSKSVVCLHEQDNGVGWKHTNYRTMRAVVTRLRELVIQFIVTLANYEYVFAYKLDTAGGITIETRATGIVSVVAIDDSVKTSSYGAVVSPGVLAQNHQHIFAVRIDPAMDSYGFGDTVVVKEESVARKLDEDTNPRGNLYEVERTVLGRAVGLDSEPRLNRLIRLDHATKKNAVSGRSVGYKLVPSVSQLLLADPDSPQGRRAKFATHHIWVTGYRDGEYWAAGEFTNQSKKEVGGVASMVARGDWFVDGAENGTQNGHGHGDGDDDDGGEKGKLSRPVVWSVFGLTHNPRLEDWPVMPVEIHQMHLKPADFFECNPALDVPSQKNPTSVTVGCCSTKPGTTGSAAAAAVGGEGQKVSVNGGDKNNHKKLVQDMSMAHMQGSNHIDAAAAGAHVDTTTLGLAAKLKKLVMKG